MLHYHINEASGNGKMPLVLLHGFLESSTMWDYLNLESDFKVLRVDLPGHGKSELDSSETMRSMAEAVKEVIDHNNYPSYQVIGHSMGGYVAIELSLIDDRCQDVTLLNSNIWSDPPEKQRDRERVAELVKSKKEMFIREAIPNLFDNPQKNSTAVDDLITEALEITPEAVGASSIAMSKRKDYSDQVSNGQMQLNVIQGRNDKIANIELMKEIMKNQQDRFFVVESGHMAHIVATKSVREIIVKILK